MRRVGQTPWSARGASSRWSVEGSSVCKTELAGPGGRPRTRASAPQSSELQLRRQLNRPRSADLVQRIETAVRATLAESIRQRLCRAAKERVREEIRRVAEIRVIQNIEKLRAEPYPGSLRDTKDALHPD